MCSAERKVIICCKQILNGSDNLSSACISSGRSPEDKTVHWSSKSFQLQGKTAPLIILPASGPSTAQEEPDLETGSRASKVARGEAAGTASHGETETDTGGTDPAWCRAPHGRKIISERCSFLDIFKLAKEAHCPKFGKVFFNHRCQTCSLVVPDVRAGARDACG